MSQVEHVSPSRGGDLPPRSVSLIGRRLRNGALAVVVLVDVLGLAALLVRPWARPEAAGADTANWLLLTHEGNPSTWLAATLLLAVAGLAALAALVGPGRDERRFWMVAALVLVAASFDEIAAVHERLDEWLDTGPVGTYAWILPGLVVAGAICIAFARGMRVLPRESRRALALAGAVYFAGALGIEAVAGWWDAGHGNENVPYHLISLVEENLEYLGVVLLGAAIARHVRGRPLLITPR